MAHNVRLELEAFPAVTTREWFLPCVGSLMFEEDGPLGKTLPTLHTGERLLPRVYPPMVE